MVHFLGVIWSLGTKKERMQNNLLKTDMGKNVYMYLQRNQDYFSVQQELIGT